jgi:hypothetical protein
MAIDVRRVTAGLLAVALLLVVVVSARAETPEAETGGVMPPRLSYVEGQVSFWRPGAEAWTPAQANVALAPGDELNTGRTGNVELQIGARAFVRAWGDTQFGLANQTPDLLHLKVADGHVAVDLRALDAGHLIQIDTPGATFSIERPGYYRVDVAPARTSFITRRAGQATMTRVEAGTTRTSAAPDLDVWDRWNEARTDELLDAASARYVPEGVYGVHDLDYHGDWRVLPTYGAVWVPRGSPAGWAPYTTGRWVWDPRFGWTWVDTAVWGWAPYHHGRWVHLDGVWAWAPGPIVVRPVYAPALVAFFSAPGVRVTVGVPFVSWVALGWGEPIMPWWGRPGFVGRPTWHGWGGPRVVNNVVIHKTTVVHATDIRVYRNTTVNRAVVAVHPERFGRARVQDTRVTEIDTRRLQPVRGPLRTVPDAARRVEPSGRAQRRPDAERSRSIDGTRPLPRTGSPAPAASPVAPAPRVQPTPRAPRTTPGPAPSAPRATAPAVQQRVEPSRREMRPAVDRPRPQPRDAGDRVFQGRGDQVEQRRAPAAASPALRGAAAHERGERGGGRQRPDGRR